MVYLDGGANIFCFHQSCAEERQNASRQLREALASGTVDPLEKVSRAERIERQKQEMKKQMTELRAGSSLPQILKRYRWTYEEIKTGSPVQLPEEEVADGWKRILGFFKPDDVVWIGDTFDSGKEEHQKNFRTVTQWLELDRVIGNFTCPATFKNDSFSRSNENVLHRRFLVVESDVLTKDQVGSVFRWLKDEVGLRLRAVVDTGGKSLHGWFEMPKKAAFDELQLILAQLGCDPGLFRPSQPCRMPGALRDGKYQTLIYLDNATGRGSTAKVPSSVLPLPEIYYDGINTTYWRQNDHNGWQKINETSLDIELLSQGYLAQTEEGQQISGLKQAKRDIQMKQDIVYAGRLAGYRQGFHEVLEQRILVTDSPKIIEPVAGEWPTLKALLDGLLKDGTTNQVPYLLGWLKVSYSTLRDGKFVPSQALCIAGPRNSGKSLIQNLITKILGGRVAKPYQYMTGQTSFNSELFGAEHLMVEDEAASTDIRARRNFGSFIKTFTVNETQNCHGKNKQALTLKPFWRLSITVNEEPENLMVLPPIDESVGDKIMLLKAFNRPMPMPTGTAAEREKFWNTIISELPAFLDYLLNSEIPVELKDDRFGINTYHHPDLLSALSELQPEMKLLSYIDQSIYWGSSEWKGSAETLERTLTRDGAAFQYEARKLLYYPAACGTYLGRLAKQFPDRVSSVKNMGKTVWTISAPAITE